MKKLLVVLALLASAPVYAQDIIVGNPSHPPCVLIAGLPASANVGDRLCVTNGVASPTFGAIVSTTGSTTIGVFFNGTNWVYG